MQLSTVALGLALLVSSCSSHVDSAPHEPPSPGMAAAGQPDSPRIYDEALRIQRTRAAGGILVIDAESMDSYLRGEQAPTYLERDLQGGALEAAHALLTQSRLAPTHDDLAGLETPHVVLLPPDKAELFKVPERGMRRLRDRYPTAIGLTTLSRIGFSVDRRFAAVYVGLNPGSMGGYGEFYVFELTDGQWQVIKILAAWVA